MTLTEFLLARIAELEQAAQAQLDMDSGQHRAPQDWAKYIIDPARVLAECEAKRRIVEMHSVYELPPADWRPSFGCKTCANDTYYANGWCDTIKALALPSADHPQFQREWRL